MIICEDMETAALKAVIQAKQDDRIDDFLLLSNSTNYMVSKIEAVA